MIQGMYTAKTFLVIVTLLLNICCTVSLDESTLVGQWVTEASYIDSIINTQDVFRIDEGQCCSLSLYTTPHLLARLNLGLN